ncbi:hypothetical protein [Streptomyces sp. NPDC056160]|uniref:hypothetical protein n=1 Tax=Streptomyces sp. NPDC056160 TaxID=3345731 RepID=UPI0035E25365
MPARPRRQAATLAGLRPAPLAAAPACAHDTMGGPASRVFRCYAETGGDRTVPHVAVGGAAAPALGTATLFLSVRRRARRVS